MGDAGIVTDLAEIGRYVQLKKKSGQDVTLLLQKQRSSRLNRFHSIPQLVGRLGLAEAVDLTGIINRDPCRTDQRLAFGKAVDD